MQPIKSTSFIDPVTSKSYTLEIHIDDSPSNPFEEWDCEPPLMYQTCEYSRRYTTHYGTESIVSELLDLITPRRLVLNRKELLSVLEIDEEYMRKYTPEGYTFEENLREEIQGTKESLDLVESLAKIARVPYSRHESRGYSQGDYADVLIILTPEYLKKVGTPKEHYQAILDGTKKLFDAWAWGDVYGFQLVEHVPLYLADGTLSDTTDDDIVDSCWGFYGYEGIESIREHLPDFALPHFDTLN